MKKLKHVSIAVLLFVSLLTVMVGLGINAFSEGLEHNVADGKVTITKYEADAVIPTEIDGLPVTGIAEDAFADCADLADVYFAGDEAAWTALGFDFGETSEVRVHYSVDDAETHYTSEVTAPTCTADGYTTYTCACEHSYTVEGEKAGHDFVGTVTKAATCKEEGIRTFVCSVCTGTFTEAIAINPENHADYETEFRDAVDATCGTDGSTGDKYCLGCETKIADKETIPATGNHIYDVENGTVTKTPTCSEKGERLDVCTVCEYQNTVELDVDPANHVGETEIRDYVAETCAKDGYKGDTYCLSCNTKIVTGTVIPATGEHVYSTETERVESTCTTAGYVINVCDCGAEKKTDFDIDAENHADYETENRDAVTENCGNDGYTGNTHCGGCNAKLSEGEVIPGTGEHDYKDEVTKVPTCAEKGEKIFTCTVCNDVYTEEIEIDAENHAYEEEIVGAVAETCATEGYTGDTHCSGCKALLEEGEKIPATGIHNFASAVTKVANCCEKGVITNICVVCSGFYTEEIEIDAENHADYGTEIVGATAETCAKDGYTGDAHCAGCKALLVEGQVIPATGEHDYKEKVTKVATCTETGEKVFTCAVCEDTYKEEIAIDANNHAGETEIRDAKTENCGVDGFTGDTYCLSCTAKIKDGEVIPATGDHTLTSEVTKVAMCNETGIRTYTCSVCAYIYDEEIEKDKENHTGNTDLRDVVEGNCGKNGYTGNIYCSDCDAVLEEGEVIDSTGLHSYASALTKAATCCEYGELTFICSVCSDFYTEQTEEKNPLNHSGGTEIRDYVAETCGAEGYEGDKYCLGCGEKLMNGKVIPATGLHNFESEITTPATCIAQGVRTYTCTVCAGYYTEPVDIDPANHTGETEIRDDFAETCGKDGFSGNTHCVDCNVKIKDGSVIPATGNHDYKSAVTTVPTCCEKGEKTFTCAVCNDVYTEEIAFDAANHADYGTELRDVKAENCGVDGYTDDTYCKGCNEKLVTGEVIPATGNHNHIASITKHATCIETGVITHVCMVCADTFTEEIAIDAANHAGETEIRDYLAETCGEEGYSGDLYCLDCDKKILDGTVINATGNHTYDSEITVVPTCCEKGERTYICSVCEYTYTEDVEFDAENHAEYGTEIRNDSEPKCVIKGYTGDTCCSGCGAILETGEEIPETGKHDYASEVTVAATCCNAGIRTYTCIVCEDSFTEEIAKDAKNHEGETEIRDSKEATCTAVGYTGDTYCKGCDAKLEDGTEIKKTAHTEVEVAGKEATCKTTGLTKGSKCSVCDTVIKAQNVIAKLDHTFGDWTVVKAPTTAEDGMEERVCSACQKKETRPVEKLSFILGDVNGDGKVNAADARLILRVSASLDTLEGIGATVEVADMNGDGKVNAADARKVLRKAAKLED